MAYVDDIELGQFSSADACRVAGITADTFKNWVSRKPYAILMTPEERTDANPETTSRPRLALNLRRVFQIAITAELNALGLTPRQAALAAAGFTDLGTGMPCAPELERNPGELFKSGFTYLVVMRGDNFGWVERVMPDTPILVLLHGKGDGAAIVLNLNRLVARVRRDLGLDANA